MPTSLSAAQGLLGALLRPWGESGGHPLFIHYPIHSFIRQTLWGLPGQKWGLQQSPLKGSWRTTVTLLGVPGTGPEDAVTGMSSQAWALPGCRGRHGRSSAGILWLCGHGMGAARMGAGAQGASCGPDSELGWHSLPCPPLHSQAPAHHPEPAHCTSTSPLGPGGRPGLSSQRALKPLTPRVCRVSGVPLPGCGFSAPRIQLPLQVQPAQDQGLVTVLLRRRCHRSCLRASPQPRPGVSEEKESHSAPPVPRV